jgi:leucyl-tRNA synthetase
MRDEEMRQHGEDASDFAKDLAARAQSLTDPLGPERELAALERAAWLLEREFGANVVVRSAEDADDELAGKAEPGRPAIDIAE